jgi:hypothetical protein
VQSFCDVIADFVLDGLESQAGSEFQGNVPR